jgi:integral membrane protein (TIGR01906 family)
MSVWRHVPVFIARFGLCVLLLLILATANLRIIISQNYIDWRYSRLQEAGTADRIWPTTEATRPVLEYVLHQRDKLPGLTKRERSHMADVRSVVDQAFTANLAALAILILTVLILRRSWPKSHFWRQFTSAALMAVGLLIGLLLALQLDFNRIFNGWHSLLFTPGSWFFSPDSTLIRLFPLDFWVGAAGDWVLLTLIETIMIGIGFSICLYRATRGKAAGTKIS